MYQDLLFYRCNFIQCLEQSIHVDPTHPRCFLDTKTTATAGIYLKITKNRNCFWIFLYHIINNHILRNHIRHFCLQKLFYLLNILIETYYAIVLPSKNFFFWKVFMNHKGTKSTEKRT